MFKEKLHILATELIDEQGTVHKMGLLGRVAIAPDKLSVEVSCHGADIAQDVVGHLQSLWHNIFGFGYDLRENAVEQFRFSWESLPSAQQVRGIAIADHPREEEGAAALHREPDAREGEAKLGLCWRDATILSY